MADLRDFTPSNDSPRFADAPMALNEPIHENAVFVDDGGLGDLHIRNDIEEEGTGRNKLFAGLTVALLVGVAGAWGVSMYMKDQPVVADNVLPKSAPAKTAAMTPPAPAPIPATEEAAPSATTPAAMAPAAPDVVKPAPVTRQAAAPKVMAAPKSDATATSTASNTPAPAPVEQAPVQTQASNIPEPVSPTPPASALAGNPALNEQSAAPAEPAQAVAPEAPAATPAPEPAAPAAPAEAAPATPAQ